MKPLQLAGLLRPRRDIDALQALASMWITRSAELESPWARPLSGPDALRECAAELSQLIEALEGAPAPGREGS